MVMGCRYLTGLVTATESLLSTKGDGNGIVNKVTTAQLCIRMVRSTRVVSRKITSKARASSSGLWGISMKDSGKSHRWRARVSLNMLTAGLIREFSEGTTFYKVSSSFIFKKRILIMECVQINASSTHLRMKRDKKRILKSLRSKSQHRKRK